MVTGFVSGTLFAEKFSKEDELAVVLLGRPYLVLAGSLNNGIPGIFGSMGIKTFLPGYVAP
ncbi:MAG: hypothetical protein R2744_02030 [Bacteroidales bacterium]